MKKIIAVMLAMIFFISASDSEKRQIDFGPYSTAVYGGDPSGMYRLGEHTGYEDSLLGNQHRVISSASRRVLDYLLLPLNPFLMLSNSYSHGYADAYGRGASDRNNGIVDPKTRKVIYCRSKEQIEKQQAPVAQSGAAFLPDYDKVCEARSVWLFSEIVSVGAMAAGTVAVNALRENCSFKTLCLLSAAAVYPAAKEARNKLGVVFPSTKPSSVSISLPGGRTYEITNPLEKALGIAGVAYFLSKASDSSGEPDQLFTNVAKATLMGASGYAGKKLVEAGYAWKISREE